MGNTTLRYYIDCEFLEGTQKKSFLGINYGSTKPTIDLVSIGIVSEDNRKYYAISNEFNLKEAWNRYDLKPDIDNGRMKKVYWIRENVLKSIWEDYLKYQNTFEKTHFWNLTSEFSYKTMKRIIKWTGKSNKQIAEEIKEFVGFPDYEYQPKTSIGRSIEKAYPEFYVYYGDYDWVVFCWLFGKMVDLPNGFPYYARDIQQIIETYGINKETLKKQVPQINTHNALNDAIWNKNAHNWILNEITNKNTR